MRGGLARLEGLVRELGLLPVFRSDIIRDTRDIAEANAAVIEDGAVNSTVLATSERGADIVGAWITVSTGLNSPDTSARDGRVAGVGGAQVTVIANLGDVNLGVDTTINSSGIASVDGALVVVVTDSLGVLASSSVGVAGVHGARVAIIALDFRGNALGNTVVVDTLFLGALVTIIFTDVRHEDATTVQGVARLGDNARVVRNARERGLGTFTVIARAVHAGVGDTTLRDLGPDTGSGIARTNGAERFGLTRDVDLDTAGRGGGVENAHLALVGGLTGLPVSHAGHVNPAADILTLGD